MKRGDVVAVLDDSDVRSIREQAYADVKAASIRLRDAETDVQKFEGCIATKRRAKSNSAR